MPDWTQTSLGAVADVRFSNVDKKSHPGEIPVRLCNYMDVYANDYVRSDFNFMSATAAKAEIDRFGLHAGDVIITKDSETPDDIGIPAVVEHSLDNLVCGYHLALIKPRRDQIDSIFLAKQLASGELANYFSRCANGSTRYGLSSKAVADAPIRLAPLAEQQRIGEVLRVVDESIEHAERLIAKLQQVKLGMMRDLFTRGVTPDGRFRPPRSDAPHLYKESPLGGIPLDWAVATMSERRRSNRAHLKTGPFGSALKIEHWVDDGRPVITIGALGGGDLIASELLYVSEQTATRLSEYTLDSGDIVFSRVADVGRSAVIHASQRGWLMSSNLMRISLNPEAVRPHFLQLQLGHDDRVRQQIRANVNAGGRDVANSAILNRLLFPWPPVEEQDRIIMRISAVAEMVRQQGAECDHLKSLRRGLMQDLLTGRVRVHA